MNQSRNRKWRRVHIWINGYRKFYVVFYASDMNEMHFLLGFSSQKKTEHKSRKMDLRKHDLLRDGWSIKAHTPGRRTESGTDKNTDIDDSSMAKRVLQEGKGPFSRIYQIDEGTNNLNHFSRTCSRGEQKEQNHRNNHYQVGWLDMCVPFVEFTTMVEQVNRFLISWDDKFSV